MSSIRRFDHVGITVADLDAVSAFFVELGFEVEGRTFLEGEFLDTVIGIPDSRTEMVMLRPPDGGVGIELASFTRPHHVPGSPAAMVTNWGCAAWRSKWTTCRRSLNGWQRTATAWSAASASTSTSGAWPPCAGQRGSSFPSPSESTDLADGAWRFYERRLGRSGLIVSGGGVSSWRTSRRASHAIAPM